nr:hypothetical protein [Paenibacillus wynnii]
MAFKCDVDVRTIYRDLQLLDTFAPIFWDAGK